MTFATSFARCRMLMALLLLLLTTYAAAQTFKGTIKIGGASGFQITISPLCTNVYQGVLYSCQLSTLGGSPPATFAKSSGSFPTGIADVTSGGLITGTPTVTTQSCEVVTATDARGNTTLPFTICLQAAAPSAITVLPAGQSVPPSGTLQMQAIMLWTGASWSHNGTVTSDITTIATWTCPTGGNPGCGSVSASGLFTASASPGAADPSAAFGGVGPTSVTVTVTSGSNPVVTTTSVPNAQQGQGYAGFQFQASGGAPGGSCPLGYTWLVTVGSLPTGASLSSCGVLSGANISGTSQTFSVTATDNAAHTSSAQSITWTVATPSTIAVNLTNAMITPNSASQASNLATYSDGSTAAIPSGVGAATFIQTSVGSCATSCTTVTTNATVASAGNMLVVLEYVGDGGSVCPTLTTPTDTAGDTFLQAVASIGGPGSPPPAYACNKMWYAFNIAGNAANQVTCPITPSESTLVCRTMEYAGIPTGSAPLDVSLAPTQATNQTGCLTVAYTTVQANELAILLCTPNGATSFTPGPGYTTRTSDLTSWVWAAFDQVFSVIQTGQTASAAFSPSSNANTLFATFKGNTPSGGQYTSSNTTCGTVNPSTGAIIGQSVQTQCTTSITFTFGAIHGSATLTVTPASATLQTISVTPNPAAGSVGGSPVAFTATGNYSDGSQQNLTSTAQWQSTTTTVATVVGPNATCIASGSSNITATFSNVSGSSPLSCSTGATITAASCNSAAVQAALNSVSAATTTVVIPSGTCTWTSQVSYTVPSTVTNLTIQGQTTVTCSGTAGQSTWTCAPTNNTIVVDQFASPNNPMLLVNLNGSFVRITGISFHGGTLASGNNKPDGFIKIGGGGSSQLRVDHCDFNVRTYSISNFGGGMTIYGHVTGVADHDTLELNYQNNGFRYYQSTGDFGDSIWAQPTNFGSSDNFFFENNYINGGAANDCNQGGREVGRYNTIIGNANDAVADSGFIQSHQTSQGVERSRGCRAKEVYNNYYVDPTPSAPLFGSTDGGVPTLVFNNIITTGYNNDVILQNGARTLSGNNCGNGAGNAGGCKAPPNGFGYCGSASSGSDSPWDGNNITLTGYPCMDGIGRGKSDLLNGQPFPNTLNTNGNGRTWPHNLLEPVYVWNETVAGGKPICTIQNWNSNAPVANRDFYCMTVGQTAQTSATSPFNGTTGMGWGVLAFRPTTCTAGPGGSFAISPTGSYGVGYFATDTNSLYVCTATNVWTLIYTPYQYPHPLNR